MKNKLLIQKTSLFSIFILFFCLVTEAQEYIENHLLVQFKNSISIQEIETNPEYQAFIKLNEANELVEMRALGNPYMTKSYLLIFQDKKEVPVLIKEYQRTALFAHVEPNHIFYGTQSGLTPTIPNDTYFSSQWQHQNNHPLGSDLNTTYAWSIEQGDTSVVIAIIDTGVKLDHPEFAGRIWKNKSETINGIDDDNNGKIDDYQGWDFVNQDNNPTDDQGHGTAMAGVLGGNANNSLLYAGVDWNAKLMILKAGDQSNSFTDFNISSAIHYAINEGADIINMSFGGSHYSFGVHQAVQYAYSNGITLVASTGNDNNNQVLRPAAFPEVIAVGATDNRDNRAAPFSSGSADGSNYGSEIELMAPGKNLFVLDHLNNNALFRLNSGTSISTALVSGLCGLLKAQDTSRSPQQIRQILQQTARDQVGPANEDSLGFDMYFGYGLVDAYAALSQQLVGERENSLKEEKVVLYPNPSRAQLNLSYAGGGNILQIRNQVGSLLFKQSIKPSEKQLNISIEALQKGVYLLNVVTDKGESLVNEKFVKW